MKIIGKTTCHGEVDVAISKSPCEYCHPTCKECGCYGNTFLCGCFQYNHDCECHSNGYVDLSMKCDKCGPKRVQEALNLHSDKWLYGKILYNGIKSRLVDFQGSYAEQIVLIEDLAKKYTKKFDAARMSGHELDVWERVKKYPCFKGKKSAFGGSLQRSMWLTITEGKHVVDKFPTFEQFLEYTKGFKENGDPKNPVEFE